MSSNKFLELVFSPSSRLYSEEERREKSVIIDEKKISGNLILAVQNGAKDHIGKRFKAVSNRSIHSSFSPNIEVDKTVQVLLDSHFRRQRNLGPSIEEITQKVSNAYNNKEVITLVGLMFTRKNICPLKRGKGDESSTDLAEIVSLVHLNSFVELINQFYPWGVKFIILSEGKRYLKTFEYTKEKVVKYQKNLQNIINQLHLKYLVINDYEDFLSEKLAPHELEKRNDRYLTALKLYRERMLQILDPMNMQLSLNKAVLLDPKNDHQNPEKNFVPLWRSILNSLPYLQLEEYAKKIGEEFDHVYLKIMQSIFIPSNNKTEERIRRNIIEKSWLATIEHNACEMADKESRIEVDKLIDNTTFRTTINPKQGSQLGIYTMRETSSRIQPWHGTCFLKLDHSNKFVPTMSSRLELETKFARPVFVTDSNGETFCYATKDAATFLQTTSMFSFNMTTRT